MLRCILVLGSLGTLPSALGFDPNFDPRPELLFGARLAPRECPQVSATPNQTEIFLSACDQNPQNDIDSCFNELNTYLAQSATTTCQHYYDVYESCLAASLDGGCTEAAQGYLACTDYTLQAYSYCGCYFNLPGDMAQCANVQLGILEDVEPVLSVPLLPFSASVTTTLSGPIGPTISVSLSSAASLISFGGAPSVYTTTVYATSVYTATVDGSESAVTSVVTSTAITTSYGSSPTVVPPPSSQSTETIVSTYLSTEVYTTTSGTSLVTVTTTLPATRTIYSCAGGCEGAAATATETVCVRRKKTRVLRRDEI